MPGASQCAVDERLPGARREPLANFLRQDGNVNRRIRQALPHCKVRLLQKENTAILEIDETRVGNRPRARPCALKGVAASEAVVEASDNRFAIRGQEQSLLLHPQKFTRQSVAGN